MQPETRHCETCGAAFVVRYSRRRHQRFCSVVCQASRPKRDAVIRFWEKVDRRTSSDCWEWKASAQRSGYGSFYFNGRLDRAHRVAWMLTAGRSLLPGEVICHRCDNPRCVNPAHLFLGDATANARDMVLKGRHGSQKLTPDDVRAIRADTRLHRLIAESYGVTKTTIGGIKRGHIWNVVA